MNVLAIVVLCVGTNLANCRANTALFDDPRPVAVATGADDPTKSGAAAKSAAPAKETDVAIVARWRELLEIDSARDVVDEARTSFATRSTLASNGEAIALAARARFETGDEDGASALLRDAQPTEATRTKIELARARLAIERDELKSALAILRAAEGAKDSVRFPNEPECWLLYGRARVRAGDARGATDALLRFVGDAPLDVEAPSAWHMLTQAALEKGDVKAAERFRQNAEKTGTWQSFYRTRRQQMRTTPDEPLPRLGLAELWLAVDEFDRAQVVLDDLVKRAPQFARGHSRLGDVLVHRGESRAARAEFDRAIELDTTLAEARLSRAELALTEKRDEDARADFTWIVASPQSSEPRMLRAHLRLARILRTNGDRDGAAQRYSKYRELGGTEAL